MYKKYLAEFCYSAKALENSKVSFPIPTGAIFGEVGVNTFRNAIGAHYQPYSSEYVAPPSIDVVRQWFPTIRYGEEVLAKETLKKSLLPPRWSLANGINIDYAKIFWEDIIIKLKKKHREKAVPYTQFLSLLIMHKMKEGYGDDEISQWSLKLPKPLQKLRVIPKATKGESSKAPTSSKTSHSKKRKESSSAMDSNPSQPPVSTHVDTRMHKEDRCDALADSTAEADPGLSAPNDSIPQQQGMDKGTKNTSFDHISAVEEEESSSIIKLDDLAKLVSNVQPSFKDLDSPENDPIIVVDDSDEDEEIEKDEVHTTTNAETKDTSSQKHKLELEKNKAKAEATLLKAQPSFPNMEQLNELLVKSLQSEFSKILSTHDFSSSLPTKLKDLPSKFKDLTKEVKGLKNQVYNLEIELPRDLKEIPPKLDDFTKTVTSLTSQVAKLKTLQWELPAEFLVVPSQVEMV
ncbi:hypothetical protein Tco_0291193 [Tanacetum coccineum]